MKFLTTVKAISPLDGEIKFYDGPIIIAKNLEDAKKVREETGIGYCHIEGEYISDYIPEPNHN